MSKSGYRFLWVLFLLNYTTVLYSLTDKYRCMWREAPSTSMVLAWNQVSGDNPVVYYDVIDGGAVVTNYRYIHRPDRNVRSKGMNNHFARLTGLQPNTVYYFVILDSEGLSSRMSFKTTSDDPHQRLSIIAGGDSRNYRDARRNANKLVGKLRPDCVLFGGDMTGGDVAKQWKGWFDDWQYTMGSDGRLVPIITTRGNHEYSNQTLIDLFDVPSKHVYYNLTLGGDLLQVYTLNSLIACGGDQKAWLKRELENSRHIRWKVAQYHFAIRPHTRRKRERNNQLLHWATLFYQHNMNLVVESDAHVVKATHPIRPSRERGSDEGFIRDDEKGTVYIGEGCWGAPLRQGDDQKSWTRYSGSFNQFKWIFVSYDNIEVRTVRTDNADQVGEVDHNNVFFPPTGLDVYRHNGEEVIMIWPRESNDTYAPMYATTNSNVKVTDFTADVNNDKISLSWKTQQEPSHSMIFKLQRAKENGEFQTIAHIPGQGAGAHSYQIKDPAVPVTDASLLSYRLTHNQQKDLNHYPVIRDIESPDNGWKSFEQIAPDSETGMLKVFYALENPADVSIRLLDTRQRAHSQSRYKEQKAGKFLKSIDMSEMPKGRYLLTIEAGSKLIQQFQVVKRT